MKLFVGAFKKDLDLRRCDSRNLLEPSLAVVSDLRGNWKSTTLGWFRVLAGKLWKEHTIEGDSAKQTLFLDHSLAVVSDGRAIAFRTSLDQELS